MSDTIASKLETQSDVNQDQRKKRVREAVNNGLPGQVFVLPKYIAREYASKIRRTAEPGSMAFWTEGASRQRYTKEQNYYSGGVAVWYKQPSTAARWTEQQVSFKYLHDA